MKKTFFTLLAALSAGLFARVLYLVLAAPPEPAFAVPNHNAVVAHLDHLYRVAAYSITWAIQLGYVAWLGLRWQRQSAARSGRSNR